MRSSRNSETSAYRWMKVLISATRFFCKPYAVDAEGSKTTPGLAIRAVVDGGTICRVSVFKHGSMVIPPSRLIANWTGTSWLSR